MRVLFIQNCEIEGFGLYEQYMIDRKIEYTIFEAFPGDRFPPRNRFDAFFIGGTPISAYEAYEHNFLVKELKYLKKVIEQNKPCIGICGGAQFLAQLLGANVKKNPVMEIGVYITQLTPKGKSNSFFKEFPCEFPVFHWHGDNFDIPPNAQLLAVGDDCKNQAFGFKNILGLQFHLEITEESVSRWADSYEDELKKINKIKSQVTGEFRIVEHQMKIFAYKLMDNFFEYAYLVNP